MNTFSTVEELIQILDANPERFIGRPTHPVVAGVRRDIGIQPDIDDGKVFWHQIDEDQLKP